MEYRLFDILVTYKDIDLDVTGIFTPEEQMVMYYGDGSGHPGAASEFEIETIWCQVGTKKGNVEYVDVTDIYDSLELTEEIAKLCLEKIESE